MLNLFFYELVIMEDLKNYLNSIRKDFAGKLFDEHQLEKHPFNQFKNWFEEAVSAQILDPFAMAIATTGKNMQPTVRMVYMRDITEEGFVFYTNYNSQKAHDIRFNSLVSLNFFWGELERQIRIEGKVEKLNEAISDKYFNSRPRESQIGAWASAQSAPLKSRKMLENKIEELTKKFSNQLISRPENWGGYIVVPHKMEFWQGRPNRLHDRLIYTISDSNTWNVSRIYP